MLELYNHNLSVCAQKVRIVLAEKGLPWTNHLVGLAKGEQLTPEFRRMNHQKSAAAPPPRPGVSTKQATVAYFAARLKGMPDLSVAVEASLASGDMAAASFVYTGTHKGVYFGVAPTGKSLRFTSCDIFRIRGGKIAEHWGMGDIAGVLAQLKGK